MAASSKTLHELRRLLGTLSVFRTLEDDAVFLAFCQYLELSDRQGDAVRNAYMTFAAQLYNTGHTDDWTTYLTQLVLTAENACSYFAARGQLLPSCLEEAARNDLRVLSDFAAASPELLAEPLMGEGLFLPQWLSHPVDLEQVYFERLALIGKHGFGIFAAYRMFHMELSDKSASGYTLEPVTCPDTVQLSDLIGYELQRSQVVENTETLLAGKRAANILLYGDAGTGKSATVKAVANAYAEEGLRLIELSKNELHLLPRLLDELSVNPLRFILFIDDLSFQDNDDDFSALKAVLEGSVSARAHNTVIYATSNRRHIVRETFSQRAGDDVHKNDTMQETISLSERFGIQILFSKPDQQLYLAIVRAIAAQEGLEADAETLALEAERFALRKSGRSARAARQLVEQLHAKMTENCDN